MLFWFINPKLYTAIFQGGILLYFNATAAGGPMALRATPLGLGYLHNFQEAPS